MHSHTIEAMLKTLKPVLKSETRAKQILQNYWGDKIALVWTTHDVHQAANQEGRVLTEAQAMEILSELHRGHNVEDGLRWGDLRFFIADTEAGQPIKAEE